MLPASLSRSHFRVSLAAAIILAVSPLALPASTPDTPPSATDILSKAKAQASTEHKNILLEFSASWCGNCRLYEHFLADPQMHTILSRAFVFATMDTGEHQSDTKHANTPGGVDFLNSIGGKGKGVPWLAMLDINGKLIVSSDRPDPKNKSSNSNIGYPDAPEEIDWFIGMLRNAAPQLNQQDLANVSTWLTAHSTTQRH